MSDFDPTALAAEPGFCKSCKWWQGEHDDRAAEDAAIGLCVHAELTHFALQVSGHSGCNRFAARTPAAVGAATG